MKLSAEVKEKEGISPGRHPGFSQRSYDAKGMSGQGAVGRMRNMKNRFRIFENAEPARYVIESSDYFWASNSLLKSSALIFFSETVICPANASTTLRSNSLS